MTEEHSAERRALISLTRSYRAPQVLFLANRLGLFDGIPTQGADADTIAAEVSSDPAALRLLLNALVSLRILGFEGSRYHLQPPLEQLLRRDGAHYLGDFIRSAEEENIHWASAAEVMRGQIVPPFTGETRDAAVTAQVLRNVELSNQRAAASVWPHLATFLPQVERFLDLGAGHGQYAAEILRRVPQSSAVIYDLPFAIDYCRTRHAQEDYFGRIEFVAADVRDLDYCESFDLVLLNDLLVYFTREQKVTILRRAWRALKPGGMLAMAKIQLDSDGCKPALGAMFSLNIRIATGEGYLESDDELIEHARTAGFGDTSLVMLDDDRALVLARR